MDVEGKLRDRSDGQCELCKDTEDLKIYLMHPKREVTVENCILICNGCLNRMKRPEKSNGDYWRCLTETMWSKTPAVKVVAWRVLNDVLFEGWPQNLLDLFYLDEQTMKWAKESDNSKDE